LEGDCCSSAAAINERGQVVGESNDQAFLWHRGHMIGLGDLGGNYSFAQDVNDRGSVVG
jgi:probable HAF family extracellular repeat protein